MNKIRRGRTARVARFFQLGDLQAGTELTMDKPATHHLTTVLRARANDPVILFNGDGFDYHATLLESGQRGAGRLAVLKIHKRTSGIADSPCRITLAQCVSRPERMDICLRQSVELGVGAIQPIYSRHALKPGDDSRAQKKQIHWQNIITSACEQSGRSMLPHLMHAQALEQWLQGKEQDAVYYVLSPLAEDSLIGHATSQLKLVAQPSVTLIIGPESGLDHDEIDDAVTAGAIPVHLGQRVLRTETAGPVCIAILQSILGDLQPG